VSLPLRAHAFLLACTAALVPGAIARAQAVSDDVARFAVVIGNNVSDGETATLRYADDDAVATHRLLTDAGVDSRLLVRLDATSARLHRGLAPYGPPSWTALTGALDELDGRVQRARARGLRTELLIFYSGHGDVANGEGYIVLEDRRLTRTLLYEDVLARSPAHSNHVIVDACKSYFLAFEKGPGGRRARYRGSFARAAVPGRLASTGFLLSTSSDGDSHEWERYQAGVFSHEVRSGLRGAADIDRDGRITYAELGAFLATANQTIANPRYRPDFSVHPPGEPPGELSRGLLSWAPQQQALVLDRPELGHMYLESASGERVADVHVAPGHAVALYLPAERPLFLRRGDETSEYVVGADGPLRASALVGAAPAVARKGALHLAFEQLFTAPFGAAEVAAFEQRFRAAGATGAEDMRPAEAAAPAAEEPGEGEGEEQPEAQATVPAAGSGTSGRHGLAEPGGLAGMPAVPDWRGRVRSVAGWTAAGATTLGLASSLVAVERYRGGRDASQAERIRRNAQIQDLTAASIVLGAVAGAAAATWLAATLWPEAGHDRARVTLAPAGGSAAGVALWFERAW
jgi:hypothetical protein